MKSEIAVKNWKQNSFLANLDENNTACLNVQTIVESGSPFKVVTFVNGKQVRTNYFNKLQDAKNYSAFAITHYPKPSQDILLRIINTDGNEVENFNLTSDFSWFNLQPEECERLLPVEMMNSNLKRRYQTKFHVRHNEYNPFIAKEY